MPHTDEYQKRIELLTAFLQRIAEPFPYVEVPHKDIGDGDLARWEVRDYNPKCMRHLGTIILGNGDVVLNTEAEIVARLRSRFISMLKAAGILRCV